MIAASTYKVPVSLSCFNSRDGAIDSLAAWVTQAAEYSVSIPEMVRLIVFSFIGYLWIISSFNSRDGAIDRKCAGNNVVNGPMFQFQRWCD